MFLLISTESQEESISNFNGEISGRSGIELQCGKYCFEKKENAAIDFLKFAEIIDPNNPIKVY